MKKVIILTMFVLIACSITSIWVNTQMTPTANTVNIINRGDTQTIRFSAVNYDQYGSFIYTAEDISSWNGNETIAVKKQIKVISVENGSAVISSGDYNKYIADTSKPISENDTVKTKDSVEKSIKDYIVILNDNTTVTSLKNYTVTGQTANYLYITDTKESGTFFENELKFSLQNEIEPEILRVLSVSDYNEFLAQKDNIILAIVLLCVSLLALIFSFIKYKRKAVNISCVALSIIFIALFSFTLYNINLPSSVLPVDNLFDFAHYDELSEVFNISIT